MHEQVTHPSLEKDPRPGGTPWPNEKNSKKVKNMLCIRYFIIVRGHNFQNISFRNFQFLSY